VKRAKRKDRKRKKVQQRAQRRAKKRGEQKAAGSRRRRSGQAGQKNFEALMQRYREKLAPVLGHTEAAFAEPGDRVSMSDALSTLVEPYAELAETEEAFRAVLTLGMLAWNATLLPEEERKDAVEEAVGKLPEGFREDRAQIIGELMTRKERLFPENRRLIVHFEIVETEDACRLLVASAVEGSPDRQSGSPAQAPSPPPP